MSKRKDAKARQEHEEITGFLGGIETSLKQIDESFTKIEGLKDPAEKVLELRSLQRDITYAERSLQSKESEIAEIRAYQRVTPKMKFKKIISVGVVLYSDMSNFYDHKANKRRELREQHPNFAAFKTTLNEHGRRASTMLEDTVRDSSLEAFSGSPHFAVAFKYHEPLRDRFEAAAAARLALGDKEPVADKKTTAEPVVKKSGGYDHLWNV